MSEAALSFPGFVLPIKIPSWGGMLSRKGRQYMESGPWLALWPGLCLTLVVYSFNMFGDAVRDLFDPRLRGVQGSHGATKKKRKRGLLSRLLNPFAYKKFPVFALRIPTGVIGIDSRTTVTVPTTAGLMLLWLNSA